ncbi:hypothetical protein GQ607_006153 [Colletotrichum asianum]|uniref:non-specific serine/threonine protein kinase n=1 Tax=Colletotrichum asianum TaxID=702518 RepID=A0A8H3WHR8_9PEZI|nr:hypothetical protein GQ607_006153 [Colletotrichum asianum]
MSSATLQPAHQTPALASPPLVAASPNSRPYTSNHSSPTREAYNANLKNTTSSPASSHRPSRRPSGTGASVNSPDSVSPMTSRAGPANPVAVAPSSPDYQSSSSERRKNMPPVAPPRTSSTNYTGTSNSASSKRRDHAADKATSSPRRAQPDGTNGNADYSYSDDAAASRSRRSHQQMAPDSPHRSSGRPGSQPTVIPVRSHAAPQSTASPKQPIREGSDVLNRMVVSQPEVDVAREKERLAEAQPQRVGSSHDDAVPPPIGMSEHDDGRRGGRSRHDHSGKRDKVVRFGDYILGNTIGEGEFGKVKLGWKQDGGVQVAIKLIKRDSVGNNPSRLAKIYREIAILRGISHPNIVRLHEMVETERHIGIILEYASGGELFDYILNHRYLKDNAARRLFAQLVSGVGYLHKKGIVHRDLKLENLLLDRNRNIIITDFGFANTFDAEEELSEEEELNLGDREFVKKLGLDRVKTNGTRKGDLMQTSCGSPCYAAPELVVSDSLYTGRKVDVWSCGVILYAMLAGYLPFDDDPANPEGDNINLLYKYIVNTPLTFPEYVTPHARDLLRRILVPNPRKRADLFEVARHSWLSEYAHVVEFITSSTTTPTQIQNTTVPSEEQEASGLARSASVRESSKTKANNPTSVGGLASKHAKIDADAEAAAIAKQQRDNKRRTVQVEYVAPTTQTQRGEYATGSKSRARSNSQGPVEVAEEPVAAEKPLPRDPPVSRDSYRSSRQGTRPPSAHRNTAAAPPTRPTRDTRATSDNAFVSSVSNPPPTARPQTGGSMASGSMGLGAGARGSYGQPIPPAVAGTNAQGRIQQPTSQDPQAMGRPSVAVPAKFAKVAGFPEQQQPPQSQTPSQSSDGRSHGHKRSNTIGDLGSKLLGRNGSIFGGKNRSKRPDSQSANRKYPPVSMPNNMPLEGQPRPSIDSRASRRSFSLGLGKKRSGSIADSQNSREKPNRRFSLIPQSFSLKAIGLGRDYDHHPPPSEPQSQPDLPIQDPPEVDEHGRYVDQRGQSRGYDGGYDQGYRRPGSNSAPQLQRQGWQEQQGQDQYVGPIGQPSAVPGHMQHGATLNTGSESSFENPQSRRRSGIPQPTGGFSSEGYDGGRGNGRSGVLQKNKRFTDAYNQDQYHGHQGSSGAAKRVMDFFRRRGKARGGEER